MLAYIDFMYLGYAGRIGRGAYWLNTLILYVVEWLVMYGLLQLAGGTFEMLASMDADRMTPQALEAFMTSVVYPMLIVMGIFIWPTYAIITKRWHDRGKSGWWSLIAFVPIIGGLWMFIECGFLAGNEGSNNYGPDPAYA